MAVSQNTLGNAKVILWGEKVPGCCFWNSDLKERQNLAHTQGRLGDPHPPAHLPQCCFFKVGGPG